MNRRRSRRHRELLSLVSQCVLKKDMKKASRANGMPHACVKNRYKSETLRIIASENT